MHSKVHVLEWMLQSPDLWIIGNVWEGVRAANLFCQGEWDKIPANYWEKFVEGNQ